jgi:hypothetical protein
MNRLIRQACTATLAATLPLGALAQHDAWQWEAAVYGWFPSLGGSSSLPTGGGGSSIDISTQDVIDALKMAAMGTIQGRKGGWGVWSDVVYADFGASRQNARDFTIGGASLPAGVDANIVYDLKMLVWTTAGLYNLQMTPQHTTDLIFGVRLLDLKQTLSWSFNGNIAGLPLPGRTGVSEATLDNWDGIIGVKGRAYLDGERRWFIPYYVDIGTGQSKLTWQANAGVGYRFDWGSLIASWRYLDYQMKSGLVVQSLTANGALVGVAFSF